MATRKTAGVEEVKLEEIKLDEIPAKKTVSGGPFAPKRDGEPFVPCNREEAFLYMIATGSMDDLVLPVKREEEYLASIAYGMPEQCPDPETRHELLLYGIAYRMGELLAE